MTDEDHAPSKVYK